uniref:Cnox-4 n=1 Tax=Eleutheria dichotoma TaxID=13050 RepID=Q1HP69_9CNID|nr:Cnox-4 [Eleutheria dichotoma]
MIDTTLNTMLYWDNKSLDIFEDKSGLGFEVNNYFTTKHQYNNLSYPNFINDDNIKCSLTQTQSISKSPKSAEITVNKLQHEQDNLIQQQIQDRTISLTNMNNPLTSSWPTYNPLPRTNILMNDPSTSTSFTTTSLSPCMLTSQASVQWFNRSNMVNDPWAMEYGHDPAMRSRPCFSSHQTRELEKEFLVCQYVTRRRRIELAFSLNLSEKQIKTWFQNRRVKERKQKKCSSESERSASKI